MFQIKTKQFLSGSLYKPNIFLNGMPNTRLTKTYRLNFYEDRQLKPSFYSYSTIKLNLPYFRMITKLCDFKQFCLAISEDYGQERTRTFILYYFPKGKVLKYTYVRGNHYEYGMLIHTETPTDEA
jgi:hypothetical protein